MFGLFGLGINLESAGKLKDRIKKYKEIYIEDYTVALPYSIKELEKKLKVKIKIACRELVESEVLVDYGKQKDVCLLVYGSPLFATTHIQLINKAKKEKVKYEVIYNESVFDVLGESGLSLYKFGKITSLPEWKKNYSPTSFMNIVSENMKIQAHTLILVDPGLELKSALNILEKSSEKEKIKLNKIMIGSRLGLKDSMIIYESIEKLKKMKIKEPYCFVIPGKLDFYEEETLNTL